MPVLHSERKGWNLGATLQSWSIQYHAWGFDTKGIFPSALLPGPSISAWHEHCPSKVQAQPDSVAWHWFAGVLDASPAANSPGCAAAAYPSVGDTHAACSLACMPWDYPRRPGVAEVVAPRTCPGSGCISSALWTAKGLLGIVERTCAWIL